MDDPENELPGDPFETFQTTGEVAAYVWHKLGKDGLRQLLAHPPKDTTREDLLDISAELSGAGLGRAAAVVDELAATALPMTDMAFCPYKDTDAASAWHSANVTAWLRSQERHQREREAKRRKP
jgi:hypothetical protein